MSAAACERCDRWDRRKLFIPPTFGREHELAQMGVTTAMHNTPSRVCPPCYSYLSGGSR